VTGPFGYSLRRLIEFSETSLARSVAVFTLKVAAGLASYLLFALIARVAGPTEFGSFSVLFSVAMMIGTAGSMGQQVFLVKEVPNAVAASSLSQVYSFATIVTITGACLSAVLFLAVAMFGGVEYSAAIASGGALMCVSYACSQTTLGMLRVQDRVVFGTATRDLLWRLACAGGLVIAVYFGIGDRQLGAGSVLIILGATLAAIVVWQIREIWRASPRSFVLPSREVAADWGKVTAGLTLVAIISSADLYVFSIVLGGLVPSADVGPFFASLKTVEVINLFLMSVSLVVGPRIAGAISRGDRSKVQAECNAAIVIQGFPAVIATLVVIVAAPMLLSLFSPSFAAYSVVLRVLAVGVLINALTGATVLMLQLIGLHWRQVVFQGGSLLVALLMLPWLVERYGLLGAAFSFVGSKLLWNVLAIAAIRARIGVDPSCFGVVGSGALGLSQSLARLKVDLLAK
jgi:O-antigen/teichoic acid export membrane protein